MAKFLTTEGVNKQLANIINYAKHELVIISPFIDLKSSIVNLLNLKKDDHELKIIIVFGKNKGHIVDSLLQKDFEFLKSFPNIEINYSEHLHAKYYANESRSLLTSMNLLDYSQKNNIEFGILTEKTRFIDQFKFWVKRDNVDYDAYDYFTNNVVKNSTTLYKAEPRYIKKTFKFKKVYDGSDIKLDNLSGIYNEFPNESRYYTNRTSQNPNMGYCIRTGEPIPFNIEKPFSLSAYRIWNMYNNGDYPENFCHFTGELSNGETSFNKPVLNKNWSMVKRKLNYEY